MAYQNGTATSPADLLNQLVTFLSSNGWTVNQNTLSGSNRRVHLLKSGIYVNLFAAIGVGSQPWVTNQNPTLSTFGAINLYLGSGYNGGNAWNNQPGGPIINGGSDTLGVGTQLSSGAITGYHFFLDGSDNFVAVIEKTSGIFRYFGWGTLNKAGSYTGGQYFFSEFAAFAVSYNGTNVPGVDQQCWSPFASGDQAFNAATVFVRADVDSFTGKWIGLTKDTLHPPYWGYTGKFGYSSTPGQNAVAPDASIPNYVNFDKRTVPSLTGQANMLPFRLWVARDAGGSSLLGEPVGIYACMGTWTGYAPGDEVLYGADTYKLFPWFAVKKV